MEEPMLQDAEPQEDQPKRKRTIVVKLGALIDLGGVEFKLTHVNEGKRRLTFTPTDDNMRVFLEDNRDPYMMGVKKQVMDKLVEAHPEPVARDVMTGEPKEDLSDAVQLPGLPQPGK